LFAAAAVIVPGKDQITTAVANPIAHHHGLSIASIHPRSANTSTWVELQGGGPQSFHGGLGTATPATNGIARKLQVIALGARPVAWSSFLLIGHVA